MQIVMYCPGMPFNGATLAEGRSLGGSESAAYYLARALARLGQQVTLFTGIAPEQEGAWEGVRYVSAGPASREHPLGVNFSRVALGVPHDLLIAQRVPQAFQRRTAAKLNLWWSHDLALKRHLPAMATQLWAIDRILAVSAFHRRQIAQVYALPEEQIEVLPNALDPALFAGVPAPDSPQGLAEAARKREGGVLTYTSRPERGLAHLLEPGGIMERLAREAPELTLKVACYDNTAPHLRAHYEALRAHARRLPNVEWLGPLSKKELADLLRAAWLHVYPTQFEEVSCITAMETQAAGTPMLTTPTAALPETLADGGVQWVQADHPRFRERCAEELLALWRDAARWDTLRARAWRKGRGYDWAAPAERLLALSEALFRARSGSPRRLARHLLRHSDVHACRRLLAGLREPAREVGPRLLQQLEGYAFDPAGAHVAHYDAFARWQRERGIDQGHDRPQALLDMPRLRAIVELLGALPAGARVLDFGCGEGQFTLALARRFPLLSFLGVDIAADGIASATSHARDAGVDNLTFRRGDETALEGAFDVVLACEVLEHVPAPWATADRLERHLAPAGRMAITVPYGPWEAENAEAVPFRQHLHHLERQDLLELWGHKPGYRVLAIPVRTTREGEALGSFLVTYGAGGRPAGRIDLARKLARQAPRETLSVCIVCDARGQALARTLESVRGIADQIVLGIDAGQDAEDGAAAHGGPAWDIAARYGADAFGIASPLRTGFDAARNATLARAVGDWVLWIDDDEVLEWPERLDKYLRPNGYQGYAVKQHHYAVEPAGLIKTDLPCRLFRRRPEVRFFGVVHEHPETALNAGLGPVLVLPDVAICHNGYETEDVRRRRFARNLPLMRRDRLVYPERLLGKFLWIRDLAHLNRYALEQGQGAHPALRQRAEEAVGLWRDLLESGPVRMAVDALPYYSEAVGVLRGEGIAYEVAMGAAWGGIGELNGHPLPAVRGQFLDTADIRRFTERLMQEKTALYEEKYF